PGFAIPFFLAHPRLARLERKMMREVEGGNTNWLMRILRHETGHAIDNAYRLRRRQDWRKTFGPASRPYPKTYRPQPASKKFVLHLGQWYAQTHPTEDFAETFAVWLQPHSRWRTNYTMWPALKKLQYVDELLDQLAHAKQKNHTREAIDPLSKNTRTLREHYRRELARYTIERTEAYDRRLLRVFARRTQAPRNASASALLRGERRHCVRALTKDVRIHSYLVHNTLRAIIERCRALDLVARGSRRECRRAVLRLVEHIVFDTMHRHRQQYAL
ncbi:MAG TPA: putative zinc-binding metallopeptidase, partial [Steroidobacteraceae bacterium]|nr:putative zinc-binding metallopeptidase [Steroidobacteraceae bacterium]